MINNYDKEINDFIINVFNYYNGRINPINKAVLDINWANLMASNEGGYSRLPNIVSINPVVISRYNEDIIDLKISILSTIIHELYHTDQLINYQLYLADSNYNKYIEHACELETLLYISSHINEINNVFNLDVIFDKPRYDTFIKHWYLPGLKYERRYYHDHIFMCLDYLCRFNKDIASRLYNCIKDCIDNNELITIQINQESIDVNFNGNLIPIELYNNFISRYQCTGVYDCRYEIDYINQRLLIKITADVKNLMCKKV